MNIVGERFVSINPGPCIEKAVLKLK